MNPKLLIINVAATWILGASTSLADTGIVDKFKENDFGWQMLEIRKDMPDHLRDYCDLASNYEYAITKLKDAIEGQRIVGRQSIDLSQEEVDDLSHFLKQVTLDFNDADRRCRR